ncbi:hypothetical protein JOY44_22095 [Phormidium sp. CLA17]|uniref:hypothetical protein n=1 Tax=Leptolyngbya sp. Cla-17 TaxID=2803751 RepID=UPI001931E04F|nr:hypothetical protein [Leptolyngbya sp. Cla-17]MBM0744270.1 hypothetical protein [Leptolyngbya sp. Cla-17]
MAVMRSWQRYLIIAILTYCLLRQREIRELELGRTLFREDGYRIILGPEDNKTGDDRDFRLVDLLPSEVINDLNHWLDHWRANFISFARQAVKTLDTWINFLGYDRGETEKQIKDLSLEIQTKQNSLGEIDIKKAQRKLQSLQAVVNSWHNAPSVLQKEYVFLIFGGTTGKASKCHPLSRENFRDLVVSAVYNATSALIELEHPLFKGLDPKHTNPHFYRNIGITHERRHGDPSKREAFHKVIGNSPAEGDKTYNEMHPQEKTVKATGWWKPFNDGSDTISQIQMLLEQLPPEERLQRIAVR